MKEAVKEKQRVATDWEKIIRKHKRPHQNLLSRLICRIYERCLQLTHMTNNRYLDGQKWKRHWVQKDIGAHEWRAGTGETPNVIGAHEWRVGTGGDARCHRSTRMASGHRGRCLMSSVTREMWLKPQTGPRAR